MALIYIVDDDQDLLNILSLQLIKEGYTVEAFLRGALLVEAFNKMPCDLIISDIMMPKMNGYEVCRIIRKTSEVPIIMLSAKDEEIDKILGLELGSDDYITKPFSLREVVIKVRNMLRRYQPKICHQLSCKDLVMDIESRNCFIDKKEIELTSKEFDLLELFIKNKNHAFSRNQLIENVWGYDYYGDSRQVDHVIKRIRKKLIALEADFKIDTIWGFGYKVTADED